MEEAPVTAATGSLGPVIAKLGALLSSEYKLRRRTQRDASFIKSKLKSVHSILWKIWEREDLDEASKALKMEALDLADDMEDTIDDFILSLERSPSSMRFIQTKVKVSPFTDLKKIVDVVSGRCQGKWKKKTGLISNLFSRKQATVAGKTRARPFVRKDASQLVGLVGPRDELIQHLVGEDESSPMELQLKMASIVGMAGMGKTTLADLVYQAIADKFQSRAFLSLTPDGNMKDVLTRILEQVGASSSAPVASSQVATEEEHLIGIISNFLKDKRYLVIIDDIWHCGEWEFIRKSLPDNNLGSRIVTTTRVASIANKWNEDVHTWLYQMEPLGKDAADGMKPDIVGEDFDSSHPTVSMCGGLPLALVCLFSALAKTREHQEKQGLCVNTPDMQNSIEEQVKSNGIKNTPGFEPLVESLQLGYDHLPHHMLKTCLLYCSMYPDCRRFVKDNLVRLFIAEGFVYEEEEAKGYFDELVDRGFIMRTSDRMHPMVRNFLRWKSREDNFIAYSSEIPFPAPCRIRRLFVDSEIIDPLSGLDCSHIRSLVVVVGGYVEVAPLEKLDHLRVLDLGGASYNHHLKVLCGGLVCLGLRHLLGLHGEGISEIPPEIGRLGRLETLEVRDTQITELPSEIGDLQQLKTFVVSSNEVLKELPSEIGKLKLLETLVLSNNIDLEELPSEIGNLLRLKTLDMTRSGIKELPKDIGKLKHLEQLIVSKAYYLTTIPREIGALKELKIFNFSNCEATLPLELCQLTKLVELPRCIDQAWNKSDVVSSLSSEILSFQMGFNWEKGGLVVGAKQMYIPLWIKEHYSDLDLLDIRVCKLEEEGLKILREMPHLRELKLRFEVVPRKPIAISGEGFARLENLLIDSRAPRVIFHEGAMPKLNIVTFEFQFYGGTPIKDTLGMKHLVNLTEVVLKYNDWYRACISATIDVVREETMELLRTRVNTSGRRRGEADHIKFTICEPLSVETDYFTEYNKELGEHISRIGTAEMDKEIDECSSIGMAGMDKEIDECSSVGTAEMDDEILQKFGHVVEH